MYLMALLALPAIVVLMGLGSLQLHKANPVICSFSEFEAKKSTFRLRYFFMI
jgi:hypothetical protein